MRPLWRLGYAAAVRAFSAYLRAGEPQSAAYVGGSLGTGEPVYGLADLDIAVVVPGNGAVSGAARVRERWDRLTRAVPFVEDMVDCCVYDDVQLRDALRDSTISYGLGPPDTAAAVYEGSSTDDDVVRLLERPELYGATAAWRRVAGPERRPPDPGRDAQRRRIAAWLELQFLWRLAVELCLNPTRPGAASMCVKLVAEPARMLLWLAEGLPTRGREETLTAALTRMPDEAPALGRALELQRAIAASPDPPLAESLAAFLQLSARLAAFIATDIEEAGTTQVALLGGDEDELILPHGPLPGSQATHLLPLADWRAIACPTLPDEAFALLPGDPGDPDQLARTARLASKGPYPTLAYPRLQVRPFHGGRARLRAVQCAVTDPVSFALANGLGVAAFPDVLGWSARDTARRAVAEYGAWLAQEPLPPEPSGEYLGRLFGAGRAALFLESIDESRPELALTAAATVRALTRRAPGARDAAEAALAAYRTFADDWATPDGALVGALDAQVRALPAYAG